MACIHQSKDGRKQAEFAETSLVGTLVVELFLVVEQIHLVLLACKEPVGQLGLPLLLCVAIVEDLTRRANHKEGPSCTSCQTGALGIESTIGGKDFLQCSDENSLIGGGVCPVVIALVVGTINVVGNKATCKVCSHCTINQCSSSGFTLLVGCQAGQYGCRIANSIGRIVGGRFESCSIGGEGLQSGLTSHRAQIVVQPVVAKSNCGGEFCHVDNPIIAIPIVPATHGHDVLLGLCQVGSLARHTVAIGEEEDALQGLLANSAQTIVNQSLA